jgi:hypothetical protein
MQLFLFRRLVLVCAWFFLMAYTASLVCFGVTLSAAAKDAVSVVKSEENILPVAVFYFPWNLFRISSFE